MQEVKNLAKPQPKPEPGCIDLDRVRLGYSLHNSSSQTVTVGANIAGQGFNGMVTRILQLANGNLLVDATQAGGIPRQILLTPPYQADVAR